MAIILNEAATRRSVERSMSEVADDDAVIKMRAALSKALMIRGLVEAKNLASSHTQKAKLEQRIKDIEDEIREVI